MPGRWSGSFSNEIVTATPYQAKNGVRGVMDMDSLGDTVVTSPDPEDNSSFSLWWRNNNRNLLTINAAGAVSIQGLAGGILTSVSTRLKHGVVGFTFINGEWELSDFIPFKLPVGLDVAVTWEPRNTNGLCTIVDQRRVVSVERTAEGTWLMTTDGEDITGRIIMPTLNTIGHAVNMHPTWTLQDKTSTTVELLTGLRNPGGPFNSDDLDQDASNTISIVIASIP